MPKSRKFDQVIICSCNTGLFVEEHAVTPSTLHSPAHLLVSIPDQTLDIEDYMESEIRTQEVSNLVRELCKTYIARLRYLHGFFLFCKEH